MAPDAPRTEPVEVMLFMPEETFAEIHGHAVRLGVTDASLLAASWRAARRHIDADRTVPRLRSDSTGAVYLLLPVTVCDDALSFAKGQDRSLSWAFLKAWAMVRAQVTGLASTEQFAVWR